MKILIINEFKKKGGTEQFVDVLYNLLKDKHTIYKLYFENGLNSKNELFLSTKYCKAFFNIFYYFKLKNVFKVIAPDLIIMNNAFSSPITQFKSIKGYKSIQVVHDYTPICPKSTCLKDNGKICSGYKYNNCLKECKYHRSTIQTLIKLYIVKKTEKIKKNNINMFISPSNELNNKLLEYNYKSIFLPNPVHMINKKIDIEKKLQSPLIFSYIGAINDNKGIYNLIILFKKYIKSRNVILNIYGKADKDEDIIKINQFVSNNKNINYLGFKTQNEIYELLEKSFALIIPSKWLENYPTVILEAMINKTLVIGSKRGGIIDMISNDKGILFDIESYTSFKNSIDKAISLNLSQYENIVNNAYNCLLQDNNESIYYERLQNVMNLILYNK